MRLFIALVSSVILHTGAQAYEASWLDQTRWCVAGMEGGKLAPFHPVPWVFTKDNQVRSERMWDGLWRPIDADTINVVIMLKNAVADNFQVQLLSRDYFVAWKNGSIYRFAKGTTNMSCR